MQIVPRKYFLKIFSYLWNKLSELLENLEEMFLVKNNSVWIALIYENCH